jgi:hypothetical protein
MKSSLTLCTVLSLALVGCGGGGGSSVSAQSACAGNGANSCATGGVTGGSSNSTRGTTSTGTTSTTTSGGTTSTTASSSSALPAPTDISMGVWPTTILQTGFNTDAYWLQDGVWGAAGLTRGTYTGVTGTQYQQSMGVSPTMGPSGEVAGRISWAWPTGTTEVKSYMALLSGNKPGYANSWITPGGFDVRLLDGTNSQTYPSGKTPGSIFPLQLPIASLKGSVAYKHNAAPTGHGHLSYDIWLQNTPDQCHGFDNCNEITHEIMIPLDYWGGYGAYVAGGGGRNPAWYSHDDTIDGRLWHIYYAPDFNGRWKFIVFEPDQPGVQPGTLDLAAFINYVAKQKDSSGTPWANGNEYCVSAELGVEPVDGTGDITMFNYRIWK